MYQRNVLRANGLERPTTIESGSILLLQKVGFLKHSISLIWPGSRYLYLADADDKEVLGDFEHPAIYSGVFAKILFPLIRALISALTGFSYYQEKRYSFRGITESYYFLSPEALAERMARPRYTAPNFPGVAFILKANYYSKDDLPTLLKRLSWTSLREAGETENIEVEIETLDEGYLKFSSMLSADSVEFGGSGHMPTLEKWISSIAVR
jgi:hypothetical protein